MYIKNIKHYIKDFFNELIQFNIKTKSFLEVKEEFFKFLKNININLEEIKAATNRKNLVRGGFTNGIFLEYILIPEEQKDILIKYFYSVSNIYVGNVKIKNIIYHKFYSKKIIRDNLACNNFIMLDVEDLNLIEEQHINNIYRIGKISYIKDKETHLSLLKSKLIEEGHEVLKAYNYENLIEEIGDIYSILLHIENII
jgi:hypothetical protein